MTSLVYELRLFKDCKKRDDWSKTFLLFKKRATALAPWNANRSQIIHSSLSIGSSKTNAYNI